MTDGVQRDVHSTLVQMLLFLSWMMTGKPSWDHVLQPFSLTQDSRVLVLFQE